MSHADVSTVNGHDYLNLNIKSGKLPERDRVAVGNTVFSGQRASKQPCSGLFRGSLCFLYFSQSLWRTSIVTHCGDSDAGT